MACLILTSSQQEFGLSADSRKATMKMEYKRDIARGTIVNDDLSPEVKSYRQDGKRSAIIFIHGFTGKAVATWNMFIDTLLTDGRLSEWDVYSIGYSSRFTVDLPIWEADPQLNVCAIGFRTKLTHPPLDTYDAVAIVAHSMGGLVVQRVLLDDVSAREKVSHVVLFGTPSGGLKKARLGSLLKRQVADMAEGGEFIRNLRDDWKSEYGRGTPFAFKAVAGSEDSFVPAESSLMMFEDWHREVVPGNHIDIVHPTAAGHPSYEVLFKVLSGGGAVRSAVESARLAVETQSYQNVVGLLEPVAADLDSDATVTLSLALESLGRHDKAMRVVQNHVESGRATLDVIGVLAGRLKRRWIFFRALEDYERSLKLYQSSLENAVGTGNVEQACYHGVNVAFLKLMHGPEHESVGEDVCAAAKAALECATKAPETFWSFATIGEASLILGDMEGALTAYRRAKDAATTVRAQHSMFFQALQVAGRIYGEVGQAAIQEIFEGLGDA